MFFTYDQAQPADLTEIMTIEHSGFSADEAATTEAMCDRIRLYPDTFIVARTATGHIAGYIVGPTFDQRYLTDDLYTKSTANNPDDPYQTVLSLVVSPDYRRHGLGGQLLDQLAKVARLQNRQAVTLTCLKKRVPFYEHHGYQNEGVSASDHAGEIWYNMVLPLNNSRS